MQKLRTSISKLLVISTLWVGFALYFAQPVQGRGSSESVTGWLNQIIKKTDDVSLQQELKKLKESDIKEHLFIEQLSLIFAKYKPDQDLPLEFELDSGRLYKLLLLQWNHLQTAKGMAKAPLVETLKPANALQVDKFGTSSHPGISAGDSHTSFDAGNSTFLFKVFLSDRLGPMAKGIAIGAP